MPEFVFEGCGSLEESALRDVMTSYGLPERIFRKKQQKDPARTVVALQAADFVAYEVFRCWKSVVNGHDPNRPFLSAFADMERDWAWADKEKMDSMIPVTAADRKLAAIVAERKTGLGL
jgi:hypothetical protein